MRRFLFAAVFPIALLLAVYAVLADSVEPHQPASVAQTSIIYTATKHYEPLAWLHGGERFPQGATLMIHDANGERQLAKEFAATADANVSFDGSNVLFSGKEHAREPWQAWELNLKDNQIKLVAKSADDIIRPAYLPGGRIVYARKSGGRFVLESQTVFDGKVMALSYAPGNYLPTDVLRDGRVLFESSYPLGTNGAPEIYAVYSDGTGVESYRCDHSARYEGRQISTGDIVFPSGRGLARFTSPLAHQDSLQVPQGEYAGYIAETANHSWLVAWRTDSNHVFQINEWNPIDKSFRPLFVQKSESLIEPVVVAPRAVPNRHPSTLRDWTAANLLTLDTYTSKYAFTPGSVAKVRVYTLDEAGHRTLLGTAPVEKDGSLYVHVPGDQPLQFELLSASGTILKKESGWFWARKSEQRICVGCHAGPERAPDNAVPAVLLHSTIPADMTKAQSAADKGADR